MSDNKAAETKEGTTSPTPGTPKATSPVASNPTSPVTASPTKAMTSEEREAQQDAENKAAEAAAAVSTTTPAIPAKPATPAATETHPDPKVAALQGMFPTVDTGVIEMVLESVGGSQDRAIESLLQMTDPEFKADATASQTEENTSQLTMDEQFARALHLQEQEDLQQNRGSRRSRTSESQIPAVLPYQPRVRRARPPQPDPYAASTREHDLQDRYGDPPAGHGPGGDAPGMIAFEEKLGQYAEAGKATFNSLFSRAKAKYSELQEQHATHKATQQADADEWRKQGGASGPMVGASERKQYGGLWGKEPVMGNPSRQPERTSLSEAPPANRRWNPSDAYEDPSPPARPSSAGRRSPGPGSGTASPDKPPAGKIDLSKLGFLPKKKVDLLSTSPSNADKDPNPTIAATPQGKANKSIMDQIPRTPPAELSPHTLGDSDDDDDVDYTENPFDKK